MTAKDFNLIADIFRDLMADYRNDERATEILEDAIWEFAERLKKTNDKFNEQLFTGKCGVK